MGRGEGLREHSPPPHGPPRRTEEEWVGRIVAMKTRYPSFGPKKVMDQLRVPEPQRRWPADIPAQGDTEEERGGAAMSDAAVRRAASTGVGGEHGAEPEMECGLQGGLSIGQWAAVLSADADGQLPPLRVGVSGTEPCSYGPNEAVVGAGVSGTWAAPGQRGTVCFPGRGGLSQLSKWWVRLEMRPAKPSENGRAWTHAPVAKTAASQPQAHPLTGAVAAVRCRYIGVPLGVLPRSPAAVHSRPSPRPLPTPQWHQRE